MKRGARAVALLCSLTFLALARGPSFDQSATTTPASQSHDIDVGGHKLHLEVAGSGAPTVVFESGLGDGLASWREVFRGVASFTQAAAYDRAGYGKSDPGPEPRSYVQLATELHTLLGRAGLAPPYVLVGHSMGAAYARAFARLYGHEVAGLVFVDPFSEGMVASLAKAEREAAWQRQEERARKGVVGWQSERRFLKREFENDYPLLRAFGAPPDVPTMLLVAGRDRPRHWVRELLGQYGRWIADASEGNLAVLTDSGHYVQRDEPGAVVSAIRRVAFPSVERRSSGPSARPTKRRATGRPRSKPTAGRSPPSRRTRTPSAGSPALSSPPPPRSVGWPPGLLGTKPIDQVPLGVGHPEAERICLTLEQGPGFILTRDT